jgi:hypothetical protein
MALPFEPMTRKFMLADGTFVEQRKPSFDDWEHMNTSFAEAYREGTSLEAGLEGRAVNLRSFGPSGENHLRQYHVDESRDKKRQKREKAAGYIQPR